MFLLLQLRCAHPLHGRWLLHTILFEALEWHRGAARSWLSTEQPHHLHPQPAGAGGSGHGSQFTTEVSMMPGSPWACACPPVPLGKLGTCPLLGNSSLFGNLMPLKALGHLAASPRVAGLASDSSHPHP